MKRMKKHTYGPRDVVVSWAPRFPPPPCRPASCLIRCPRPLYRSGFRLSAAAGGGVGSDAAVPVPSLLRVPSSRSLVVNQI